MSDPITPKGLKKIGAITIIGIIAVIIYKHFVPYTYDKKAGENYVAAERHIPILKPFIEKDYRFSNVSVEPYTGQGGCLLVSGGVASDTAFLDLRHVVESSAPPVAVYYQVSTPSNYFIYTGQPRILPTDEAAGHQAR